MKTETIYTVLPETQEQETALKAFIKALKIKFEVSKERPYNAEFVEKIERGLKQAKEGKVTAIKMEDLWS